MDFWIEVAERALGNLEITREGIAFGENPDIENSQATTRLANAMREVSIGFQGIDGDRPSWLVGEAGYVESEVVWINDRASAGAGIYLWFPVFLDNTSLAIYATSLGIEDQYSNSFGIVSEQHFLKTNQIIEAQSGKSKGLAFTGGGFCSGHTLTSTTLPELLQDIPGAADYIGETLSQFAAELSKAIFWKGLEAVLSNPQAIFEGIQHLWLRSIEELELIEFA